MTRDEAADHVVEMWTNEWKGYFERIANRTGLTLDQAIAIKTMWEIVNLVRGQTENVAKIMKHMEEEHGDEPWKDKPND